MYRDRFNKHNYNELQKVYDPIKKIILFNIKLLN